jgi:group I intron endonuclease
MDTSNNTYCVYIHINKVNNKAYVGQTIYGYDLYKRWKHDGKGYLKKDKNGKYTQPIFANAIKKYGWDSFEHIVWAEHLTEDEANHIEMLLIALFDTTNSNYGYNLRSGGKHSTLSEETKIKISESRKGKYAGENNPFYGKKHTDETKRKMRENHADLSGENSPNYRKILSEETRQKIKDNHADISGENHPNYGQKLSDETRRKISESRKGKYTGGNSPTAKKIQQYNLDGVLIQIWDSISDASNKLNINRCCIGGCAQGRQKTAGGFIWRYVGDPFNYDELLTILSKHNQ